MSVTSQSRKQLICCLGKVPIPKNCTDALRGIWIRSKTPLPSPKLPKSKNARSQMDLVSEPPWCAVKISFIRCSYEKLPCSSVGQFTRVEGNFHIPLMSYLAANLFVVRTPNMVNRPDTVWFARIRSRLILKLQEQHSEIYHGPACRPNIDALLQVNMITFQRSQNLEMRFSYSSSF